MNNKEKLKKVLLFTRPLTPPWDEASKNLAFEIAKYADGDFLLKVMTTKNVPEDTFKKRELLTNHPERLILEKIFSNSHARTSLDSWEKIKMISRVFKFPFDDDVIHFLFTPRKLTSLIFKLRLLLSKTKAIQTIATINEKLYENPSELKNILFADAVVAQSNYTRKRLLKAGINNVELIYPGIDLDKYSPTEKNVAALEEMGVKKGNFVVLYAGEYIRLNAIGDVVSAIKTIQKDEIAEKITFVMACRLKSEADKIKKAEVQKDLPGPDIKSQIVYLDTYSNMPVLYNLSDLNIFPVREMTGKFDIPLALVEAMACEKPLIVTNIPVLEEFIKNNENGWVIPKADSQALSERILFAIKNDDERKRIAHNAARFVKQNFDIEKNVKFYEKLYNRI